MGRAGPHRVPRTHQDPSGDVSQRSDPFRQGRAPRIRRESSGACRARSSDWEPSAFENAGVADQHVSQTAVCDIRAKAPSGARRRVSYPVSDSMSCRRRANEHGSETRADTPALITSPRRLQDSPSGAKRSVLHNTRCAQRSCSRGHLTQRDTSYGQATPDLGGNGGPPLVRRQPGCRPRSSSRRARTSPPDRRDTATPRGYSARRPGPNRRGAGS